MLFCNGSYNLKSCILDFMFYQLKGSFVFFANNHLIVLMIKTKVNQIFNL